MDPTHTTERARHLARWALGSVVVLGVLAWLALRILSSTFGSEDQDMLDAIKRDPMATYVPAGAKVDRVTEIPPGFAMGMTSSGGVTRTFVIDRGTRVATLHATRVAARRAGWKIESSPFDTAEDGRRSFRADKDSGAVPNFELWAGLIEERNLGGGPYPSGKVGLQLRVEARPIG